MFQLQVANLKKGKVNPRHFDVNFVFRVQRIALWRYACPKGIRKVSGILEKEINVTDRRVLFLFGQKLQWVDLFDTFDKLESSRRG